MQQYLHTYTSSESLCSWLHTTTKAFQNNTVLIQMFSGVMDEEYIQNILNIIAKELPKAVVIGTSTGGEILNESIHEGSILFSLSIFEHTLLSSCTVKCDDDFLSMKEKILREDTKCLIAFGDGLTCDGDEILEKLNTFIPKEIVLAGGMSGDNKHFTTSYVIYGSEILHSALVLVSLSSKELYVSNGYNLGWKPIGKKMTITKSHKNIVYEIDNKPVKEIYAKYLGEDIVKYMPKSGIEFPLITIMDGDYVARTMLHVNEDGSIVYAGDLKEGLKVHFGIGCSNMVTQSTNAMFEKLKQEPIEALYSYSCTARKTFFGNSLHVEFEALSQIAPLSGFFTYGEFFHTKNKNHFYNVTTTVLGLSEKKHIERDIPDARVSLDTDNLTINALSNLVDITIKENEEYAQNLKLKNKALNSSANGIMITDIDGNIVWGNNAYSKLTGYSPEESLGLNPRDLVNSHTHDEKFFELLWNTILDKKVWHGEVKNRRKDGSIYHEEMTITPMMDESGEIEHFVAVKQDVTKRKEMQALIHKFAFYDNLTQLPNRRLLEDRFLALQSISKRSQKYGAMLFLDLDNFKPLNDEYGHAIGDLLLVEVARRLKACVRESDTVSRFGGDEFVILLAELDIDEQKAIALVEKIAHKIREALAQPYYLVLKQDEFEEKIVEHRCTSSIGGTIFLEYQRNFDDVLKISDIAMYQAKEAGRNRIVLV